MKFRKGHETINFSSRKLITLETYQNLPHLIDKETTDSDEIFLFTEQPYDNNYFWESNGKRTIVSLYGWDYLTTLSRNNGVIYFICAIILRRFGAGIHFINMGCINDSWVDKTGVDVGMRAAFICPTCMEYYKTKLKPVNLRIIEQVQAILHELSVSSRANEDTCGFWESQKNDMFEVFICHNSQEKDEVRNMNVRLKKRGIITWFDEEQLPPGRPWQELLEANIEQVKTAAVFVGSSGFGPWQDIEVRAFLTEFVRRKCPIIPVILPSCNSVPALPLFLRQLTWVDFRKMTPDPFSQLVWGITGKKPV